MVGEKTREDAEERREEVRPDAHERWAGFLKKRDVTMMGKCTVYRYIEAPETRQETRTEQIRHKFARKSQCGRGFDPRF